jgi:DNA-binding beta-propeller fold protein YncE
MRKTALLSRPTSSVRSVALFGTAVALTAFLLISLFASSAAFAGPTLLWQVPGSGPGKGAGAEEINRPRGVAVDPINGHVFVVDHFNARIDEFTAWGEFVKAIGWSVNAEAPAAELQTCTAQSGCKAGTEGGGTGQFSNPTAIAVDSNQHIWVAEEGTHRIQVFDQQGAFLFMLGGKVNQTTNANICTKADLEAGQVCGPGASGTGPGEFSLGEVSQGGERFRPTGFVSAGPGETIYVGDVARIQKFSAQGSFQGEIAGPSLTGKRVAGLAVDPSGNVYASLRAGEPFELGTYSLLKLGSAGEVLHTYPVPTNPEKALNAPSVGALALGRAGELYAVLDPEILSAGNIFFEPRIIEFGAAGEKLLPTKEEEDAEKESPPGKPVPFGLIEMSPNFGLATQIAGLATSGSCGLEADDIFATYATEGGPSLLRAFGPNPDPTVCPPPEVPPTITEQFASSVSVDNASLQAKINSHFWRSTTYFVEYGLGKCSEGGCQEHRPIPSVSLNSGSGVPVLTAGVPLQGLAPATTYHFRFVAATRFEGGSEEEVVVRGVGGKPGLDGSEGTITTREPSLPPRVSCPNQQFRGGLAEHLTDCRAYEMVSPVDKEGADVVAVNAIVTELPARLDQSAVSGEAFTFSAYRAFADPVAAPFSSQFLSRRGSGEWSIESISPGRGEAFGSALESADTEYLTFSDDLCQGWLRLPFAAEPQLDPAELRGFPNLFRRENCGSASGAFDALTTFAPPHITKPNAFNPQVQGISSDGRCTVFKASDTLTTEAPVLPGERENILYEDCGGTLRLVAILPDGTPAQSSSAAGLGYDTEGNIQYGLRSSGDFHAVSQDGTSIYWTAPGEPGVNSKIYLRINADKPQSEVASGECTEPEEACTLPVSQLVSDTSARFWTASTDGTRAFFSIGEKAQRLYEYSAVDPAEPEVALVAEGIKDGVEGMLGASDDASRIYFTSRKPLAPGAVSGKPNLYFLEVGEEPRLVGILDPSDLNQKESGAGILRSKAISYDPGFRAARVSADGLHAVFMSSASLTGFDNTDQRNGEADREVFVYDATADGGQGRLVCVSCDPTGTRPLGQDINFSQGAPPVWAAARIPTWTSSLYPGNPLTTEGSTVHLFFDSFVPLSPRDTNGRADVYEWQSAAGKTACEEAGAETYVPAMAGCLSLISSGQGDRDSEFIDADPAGGNVFFATGASLLPQDPGSIDIYDAREGGGFPAVQAQLPCEGEACQQGSPASSVSSPASNVLRKGNRKPAKPCPKGKRKVKRKGGRTACVAKNHHHKHKKKNASGKGSGR